MDEARFSAVRKAGNYVYRAALLQRPQQVSKRVLALAFHDEVDWGAAGIGVGRKRRIVTADDDPGVWRLLLDQCRDLQRGLALEGHDRQSDDGGCGVAYQPFDGAPH